MLPVLSLLTLGGTLIVAFVAVLAGVGLIVVFRGRSLYDPQRVTELRCAKPVVSLVSASPVYPPCLGVANCENFADVRTGKSLLDDSALPIAHVCKHFGDGSWISSQSLRA